MASPADATPEQTDMSYEAQELALMLADKANVIKQLKERLTHVTNERDDAIMAKEKLAKKYDELRNRASSQSLSLIHI